MAQFTFIPNLQQKQPQPSIADALQSIAQQYVQNKQQRSQLGNMMRGLQGLGFSDQESQSLSSLPEPVLQTVLKGLSQRGFSGGIGALQGQPQQPIVGTENIGNFEQPLQPQQPQSIRDVLAMPTLHEQREDKKLALKEKQLGNQEVRAAYKDTAPYRTKVLEEKTAAQNVLDDLERMKELETGDAQLDTPGYVEFLERTGLNIPALMNPESEEFQKLRQTQLRDAKQYFGGRVSNFEMDQFLKSIPSLNQSPEGRKRVIANMERINKLKVKTADIMRKIIKENKGIPPLDLAEQVEERMGPEREKISEQFKKDLKREVPKGQNQYVTALQALGGSALSTAGKILPGAAAGAAAGGLIGGLPGAGIGALGGAAPSILSGLKNLF